MDSWPEIPEHLVEIFAEKIDNYGDFVNFGAVCKLWRSAYRSNLHRLPHNKLPILHCLQRENPCPLILSSNNALYRVTDEKVAKVYNGLHLPDSKNEQVLDSSRGWLMVCRKRLYDEAYLLNPLTGEQISLPSISSLIGHRELFGKFALSSDPMMNRDSCIIMVTTSDLGILGFCNIGAKEWTILEGCPLHLQDVINYNGLFYALDSHHHTLYAIDTTTSPFEISTLAKHATNERWNETVAHLVKSPEEFLLVVQINEKIEVPLDEDDISDEDDLSDGQTKQVDKIVGFDVFKLIEGEFEGEKFYEGYNSAISYDEGWSYEGKKYPAYPKYIWTRVKDIGNHALFIESVGHATSLDTSLHPGIKGNSIYFIENETVGHKSIGIFNLEDGSMEFLSIEFEFKPYDGLPTWISPNP